MRETFWKDCIARGEYFCDHHICEVRPIEREIYLKSQGFTTKCVEVKPCKNCYCDNQWQCECPNSCWKLTVTWGTKPTQLN